MAVLLRPSLSSNNNSSRSPSSSNRASLSSRIRGSPNNSKTRVASLSTNSSRSRVVATSINTITITRRVASLTSKAESEDPVYISKYY
jgi:hypothetical protein